MLQSTPPTIVEASIATTADAESSPPAAPSPAESTPDPTTPEAHAAASDGAPVRRPSLPDDVLSVLLAASTPLTLDEIQADVNAGPGGFTPLQFVEDELETLIKGQRVAFTFEGSTKRYLLTPHARAEIEAPGIVIERRGNVLLALARVTLGSGNLEFEHVEGTTSKPATVSAGASAEEIFEELRLLGDTTLTQALVEEDALALCRAGVLIVEEDADPAHAADLDAAEEIEDESDEDETDEEIDDSDAAEDIEPRAPVSTVKVFTFALGQVDELFRVGARELSLRTMPPKEAPLSLPGAEEEAAAVLGRFEEKLRSERLKTADMETERDRYKHDLALLRAKWMRAARWLDVNGGGTDIDAIAAEPKTKTDPRIFEWSKRVRVTEAVKASILDELNLLDTQLGEIATAEELSKASFKEKKAKIATKTAELKSASRGYEYHWVKQAYKDPDWQRKVVVVRSAETHDYGTPLDEEPIPTGAQAPLFTGVQAAPPTPVPPAVDPSIAPVLGGEPKPDFTPAPTPPPAEASASASAPVDPDAPAFTKKVDGAAEEEEEDAPSDKPAPLAIEMTTDNLRRLLTDLYTRNPSGIHEREEPIKFGESFAPGRPISASVATFVSRVSAMMVKDETLIEVEGTPEGGRLRWLATQTDPRRLSPEALATAQAEAGKQKPVLGMPRKAEEAEKAETEAAKKGRGRPKGSKNKPKDPAAPPPEKTTKGKGGKGASKK